MQVKERSWSDSSFSYRFSFNGYEREDEVAGQGSVIDFGARIYDSRLGRFFSTDPITFAYWSPYQYDGNSPTLIKDEMGMGPGDMIIIFSGAVISSSYQPRSNTTNEIRDRAKKFGGNVQKFDTDYYNKTLIVKITVDAIKDWVKEHPDAKISLVGYSFGGVVATDVARQLNEEGISVELLYTVDAENGYGDEPDRTIPSNVKLNVNKYQTNGGISLTGGKNSAEDPSKTTVVNEDQTDKKSPDGEPLDHFSIDDYNVDDIIDELEKATGSVPMSRDGLDCKQDGCNQY